MWYAFKYERISFRNYFIIIIIFLTKLFTHTIVQHMGWYKTIIGKQRTNLDVQNDPQPKDEVMSSEENDDL